MDLEILLNQTSVMPEELILDDFFDGLTAQGMTCLVGGMRVLGTNHES